MRALCASIITAGSLIGLGLAALGVGTRYQGFQRHLVAEHDFVRFRELDTALMLIIVVLLLTLLAGLAMTYLGLAYHHERRHFERHSHASGNRTGVSLND